MQPGEGICEEGMGRGEIGASLSRVQGGRNGGFGGERRMGDWGIVRGKLIDVNDVRG